MRQLLALMLMCVASLGAQAGTISRTAIGGHSIGESATVFLSAEPEVQRKVDTCRQSPQEPFCAQLLAASEGRERVEVSTGDSTVFMLDSGKLVRLTMPTNRPADAEVAELSKQVGHRPRQIAIAGQNIHGAKWENSLFVWVTPDANVTLYLDNDPSLTDHRPLLIVEARPQGKGDTVSVKQLARQKLVAGHVFVNPSQTTALR